MLLAPFLSPPPGKTGGRESDAPVVVFRSV